MVSEESTTRRVTASVVRGFRDPPALDRFRSLGMEHSVRKRGFGRRHVPRTFCWIAVTAFGTVEAHPRLLTE